MYTARREGFIKSQRSQKVDENNWCFSIWKILNQLGLGHVWESEEFGSLQDWDVVVRATIRNFEEKLWRARLLTK